MNMLWLFRMARWARRPPSPRTVAVVLAVVGLSLGVYALEAAGLLPGWMALEETRATMRVLR